MKRAVLALVLFVTGAVAARAETLYVTDVLVVLLRATPAAQGATVKQLTSGAALEVLDRQGTWAKVREPQGASGWIEARYLVPQAPAGARLAQLRSELEQAQARLAELERRPPEPATSPLPPVPAVPAAPPLVPDTLWLAISSAMLVIGVVGGFVAGVSWLRAWTRRKLGGMTINIRNL